MIYRTIQLCSKRVPLLQFRYGGNRTQVVPATSDGSSSGQASSKSVGSTKVSGGPVINDTELPSRFARKPISPLEMELINNGGVPN